MGPRVLIGVILTGTLLDDRTAEAEFRRHAAAAPATITNTEIGALTPATEEYPDTSGRYYMPVTLTVTGDAATVLSVHEKLLDTH
ncbi:MAG: hypothetical protein FJW80_07620 [Actinobacteria bacterium]|nr:hypothetical protein [Actinomycetota bacterium]